MTCFLSSSFWTAHFSCQSKEFHKDRVTQTQTSSEDTLFSTFQKIAIRLSFCETRTSKVRGWRMLRGLFGTCWTQQTRNCISCKNLAREMFVLQESCYLKFHLVRILQDEVYLARILQETCQKNALFCKILQDILQDSCKICIFFQLGHCFPKFNNS